MRVKLEIMNVIEINDQLSTLTFIGKLELSWNETRIKILNPEVFLTHDFSRHCLWSPSVFFRNQIYAKRQERIQNDLALKIYNRTDQVMSYALSYYLPQSCEQKHILLCIQETRNFAFYSLDY